MRNKCPTVSRLNTHILKSLIASLLAEKHCVKGKSRLSISISIVTLQTMKTTLAVTAAAVRPGTREGSTRAGHMAKRAAKPELYVSALNVKLNFLKLFRGCLSVRTWIRTQN